jgi:hypothetical protein
VGRYHAAAEIQAGCPSGRAWFFLQHAAKILCTVRVDENLNGETCVKYEKSVTKRNGGKDPPARNKIRRSRTNTTRSKAKETKDCYTERQAKRRASKAPELASSTRKDEANEAKAEQYKAINTAQKTQKKHKQKTKQEKDA